jgi:glycosyltransferase involved in cell wall biosynthesis
LRKANHQFKPDVVFAHSVLPAAYARVAGVANVISVLHGPDDNYGSGRIALAELGLQYRLKGVVSVSPTSAEYYARSYSVPSVVCIPNGIAIDAYKDAKLEDRVRLLTSLGLPTDALVVLQVGRITGVKQQYLSVRAIAPLINENPRLHLLLAGIYEDPESLSELETEIRTHNLAANVHLIGPRDDVATLLQLASLYLMPSKQEAQGIALIEAIASGVAVVASDIPPFDYTRNMAGIVLTDPNISSDFSQAVEKLLAQSQRYSRDLTDFDICDTAKQYIDFAKSCLA